MIFRKRQEEQQQEESQTPQEKEKFDGLVQYYLALITKEEIFKTAMEQKHLRKRVDIFMYRCGDDIKELLEKEQERYRHCFYDYMDASALVGNMWMSCDYDVQVAAERRAREIYYQHEQGYFEEGEHNEQ